MWTEIIVRLHFNPGNVLAIGGGTALMAITCLFCWFRGAKPDRLGAAVFAAFWIIETAAAAVHLWNTGDLRPPLVIDVLSNVVPGAAFLWLALRYDSLWFGAVALFQGVQYALDAADRTIHEPAGSFLPLALITSVNVLNLFMMAAMIGSTLSHLKTRGETAAQPA